MAIIGSISLVLTLCTAMGCNSYEIDNNPEWKQPKDCQDSLVIESEYIGHVWNDSSRLSGYVTPFAVREAVGELTDYDFTCEVNTQRWASK